MVTINVVGNSLGECLQEIGYAGAPPADTGVEFATMEVRASGQSTRMGPVRRAIFNTKFTIERAKTVGLRQAREELRRLSDVDVMGALYTVAAATNNIDAIGDGTLFEKFLAFLSEHWDEILKLILMLIGI